MHIGKIRMGDSRGVFNCLWAYMSSKKVNIWAWGPLTTIMQVSESLPCWQWMAREV